MGRRPNVSLLFGKLEPAKTSESEWSWEISTQHGRFDAALTRTSATYWSWIWSSGKFLRGNAAVPTREKAMTELENSIREAFVAQRAFVNTLYDLLHSEPRKTKPG
jgi:hypothetical protein